MDSNFIKSYPNFLPKTTFNRLQKYVLGGNFPWWYTITDHNPSDDSILSVEKVKQPPKEILGTHMMTHVMYVPKGPETNQFSTMLPIIDIIKEHDELSYGSLLKLKLNMYLKGPESRHLYRHTDFYGDNGADELEFGFATGVFCFTTDNGGTTVMTKDGKELNFNTTENTLIVFNGTHYHGGFTQTNKDRRVILNINYRTAETTIRDIFYEDGRY